MIADDAYCPCDSSGPPAAPLGLWRLWLQQGCYLWRRSSELARPRVGAAKWVAKLCATKTDQNGLLLRTKMEAGHGGVSGRYMRYKETAFIYAFLLDLVGVDR